MGKNDHLIRYATRKWLLQERGHLTELEARLYLMEERADTFEELSRITGVTPEDLQRIKERAERKIRKAEESGKDIFCGYTPIYPKNGKKPDW